MDIKAAVLPIASRWYELGECLRLKASDLEALQSSHLSVERALTEVLKLWLRQVRNLLASFASSVIASFQGHACSRGSECVAG